MPEPIEIADPADERLADYARLTDGSLRTHLEAAYGLFIAEGTKVITRAVAAGYPVRSLLLGTATDHACPAGGVQSYLDEGRSAEFTATCVGTPDHNGFYGEGIVNALGVVE